MVTVNSQYWFTVLGFQECINPDSQNSNITKGDWGYVYFRSTKKQKWVVFNKTVNITETTTTVTKLTKMEEYSFRVSAVNEIGTSEPSDASKPVKVRSHIFLYFTTLFIEC